MHGWWLWICVGYVCGSIPFSLLIGKAKGVDIRRAGSGNIGATNLGRLLGLRWGVLCFVLDMLKGAAPVVASGAAMGVLGHRDLPSPDAWQWLAVGAATVVGHIFPIWPFLRGGKGIATGLGAAVGFWPILTLPGLAAFATWIVVVAAFRYVGLASVVAAVSSLVYLFLFGWLRQADHDTLVPFYVVTGLLVALVVVRHRTNIAKLIAGMKSEIRESKVRSEQGS